MMTYEKWLPVVGYEGRYEVSNQGRVRSVGRIVKIGENNRRIFGRILKLSRGSRYLYVGLSDDDGRVKRMNVHILVLTAFVGPCPEGMEALHGPGGSHDNSLANLRWDTRDENNRDLVRHSRHHYSRRTRCDKGHELKPRKRYGRESRYCPTCQRDAARQRKASA
ncbi:HNH endonuclease [Mycobacterium phage Phineas]|nr:HNH endonuclease [Mycobacterium phage Phineas]QDB74292.1 HNH endonuclease [Mycobacterium phage Phineas]